MGRHNTPLHLNIDGILNFVPNNGNENVAEVNDGFENNNDEDDENNQSRDQTDAPANNQFRDQIDAPANNQSLDETDALANNGSEEGKK